MFHLRTDPNVQQGLARGLTWLLSQQQPDGGWHSATYGALKAGAGLSALVADTLARLPRELFSDGGVITRLALFFAPGLTNRKTVAAPDGTLDYPVYASAQLLRASRSFPDLLSAAARTQLVAYLLAAQLNSARGFSEDAAEFGGWDQLGRDDARGITTGTNVSVMCCVLEALADENHAGWPVAREAALHWLARAQDATSDGGFPFTAAAGSLANKAGWSDERQLHPRSYGSATCDGLRCLIACGQTISDDRVIRARKWVFEHADVERVPGFLASEAEPGWEEGLRFYYARSLAHVLRYLAPDKAQERRERLAAWLLSMQHADGYWKNRSDRMREDDPLIATCFAMEALGYLAGMDHE